ncbi:unnamed protein product [Pleuronectes platessa]|uniref:Uncharacterized protein n=1 Tax=Pleuronectes platessa TaxID=8262 RepID=A0A9N7YB26_PLEPL|nr:unnamed protein product [Pleuronectes platessa]
MQPSSKHIFHLDTASVRRRHKTAAPPIRIHSTQNGSSTTPWTFLKLIFQQTAGTGVPVHRHVGCVRGKDLCSSPKALILLLLFAAAISFCLSPASRTTRISFSSAFLPHSLCRLRVAHTHAAGEVRGEVVYVRVMDENVVRQTQMQKAGGGVCSERLTLRWLAEC